MESVPSSDGTTIAYEQDGQGPPMVLVHGSTGTRRSWDPLRPHLADEFSLAVPDRRGRGDSGDADEHSLEREVDDVRAVVEAVDGDPVLFGHSFGGLCALEAARTASIERLVLYEPALLVGEHRENAGVADRMQERLDAEAQGASSPHSQAREDAGDRRETLELFFREAGGVPDLERAPFWPDEVNFDLAETVVRESRAVEEYRLADDLDVGVQASGRSRGGRARETSDASLPVLLLTGEHGPEHLRDGIRAVHDRLDDSRLVELDGVGHVGPMTAPDRVADEVRAFVREDSA